MMADATGLSYYSKNSRLDVCSRFSDGCVVGSNQWLLTRNEIMDLVPLLVDKIGEPLRNQMSVLP